MGNVVLKVVGIGKKYYIGRQRESYSTLRDSLSTAISSPVRRISGLLRGQSASAGDLNQEIWVLRDIDFEVQHGEVVGIIGRNGAGKSTLLKVLSRITKPTTGYAEINGRVGSLLEVGTGFHEELTGRENIYLNGAILGMTRHEINYKFDEMVDFAGVEKFIDTPVKHYSSGMKLRLGFSVAAHLEPDILVVDEVLAVGDVEFQKKCLGKMQDVAGAGRTVLFVSHNMVAVSLLCERVIVLNEGNIISDCSPDTAIADYLKKGLSTNTEGVFKPKPQQSPIEAVVNEVRIINSVGQQTVIHDLLRPIQIEVDFTTQVDFNNLLVACQIRSHLDEILFVSFENDWTHFNAHAYTNQVKPAGNYQAMFTIPAPLLNAGRYEIVIFLLTPQVKVHDTLRDIFIEVEDRGSYSSVLFNRPRNGIFTLPLQWEVRRVQTLHK